MRAYPKATRSDRPDLLSRLQDRFTPVWGLIWELLWRNRIVLPVQAMLWGWGAGLSFAIERFDSTAWWLGYAKSTVFVSFLVSLLMGLVPFTLMESHGSWRMNSMVTRWFSLPVRTSVLVLVPMVVASSLMSLLICAWTPLLRMHLRAFDLVYFLVVVVAGVVAVQALAWIVPRKPAQFWPLAGFLFLTALIVGLLPQGSPHWDARLPRMSLVAACLLPVLPTVAVYAARRNRCGDWPGELRLAGIWRWLSVRPVCSVGVSHGVESPAAALFWSEAWGPVKRLFLSWLAISLVMTAAVCWVVRVSEPDLTVAVMGTWIGVTMLPVLSVFWLGLAGLLLGGGAGAGFRRPLPHCLATLPVSTGTLATQRLIAVLLVWVLVWIPLWLLLALGQYDRLVTRIPIDQAIRHTAVSMAGWMAISAHAAVGALPLVLRGRLAGFPAVFLGSMVCWIGPLLLYLGMKEGDRGSLSYAIALAWLAAKIGVAAWVLVRSNRAGQITWRFVCGIVGVWLGFATLLIWGLPTWQDGGVWRAVTILLFLPLARPALCPLALDTNRHR